MHSFEHVEFRSVEISSLPSMVPELQFLYFHIFNSACQQCNDIFR